MTGIFLTISWLWLFATVCHTLDIPLQSALLMKGEPVGFTRSSHRQKRSDGDVTCKEDEYKPRKAKHCCNKCLAGFMVVKDCPHEGMKSQCEPCPTGYFRKSPSGSKSCFPCYDCLTQFGQVTLQSCTTINDTVCGCPAGQYKSDSDLRKFTCLECSKCDNGTVLHSCTVDRNTVCKCFFNFYLDSTGKCRSCNECNDSDDCVNHCPWPPHSPVGKPKESNVNLIIIPCAAVVVLLAVAAVLIVKYRKKISSALQAVPTTDISETSSNPLMDSSSSTCKSEYLPGQPLIIVEDSGPHQNTALNSSLPLPDITLQTKMPSLNRPEVLYKIIECVPVGSWKELIRRLGVSDQVIDQAEYDYRRYKDAQYAMLSFWVCNEGSAGATRDSLFRVLREMNLGGCVEKIEEIL
ncbi:tumor necrosis factor receptor superfamily member 1A [Hyla sarda]|uniref:tumor necrosis factor receptor superfamily member 1A n=1 Tax=Hyla sarda TaxID=327740 RepID=UPI0024C2FE12|nr:tumor necrosis factor receptor superfamily member 1A [Hyla sarda]